jgi:putative endopeptidase
MHRPDLALAALCLCAAPVPAVAQSAPDSLPPLKVVDTSYIDRSANACTNFFQFANGAWVKRDTIPAAYSASGVSKDMSDRNEEVVRALLEETAAKRATLKEGSTERKLGIFYGTCMDSASVERAGMTPIVPLLQAVDGIKTRADLVRQIGDLHRQGANVLFAYFPYPDPHEAGRYMAWFWQGGLGMPDRDFYTDTGAGPDSLRRFYVGHIAKYLTMIGQPASAARRDAGRIMALETALARASLTRVQLRDPAATDHPTPLARFHSMVPRMDWPSYFGTIGLTSEVGKVNVAQPRFFARVDTLLGTTPLATWRAYLKFHIVELAASALSTPFVREDFAFQSRFTGAKELLPRWKRCLRSADSQIGEALGQAYVAKTFPPEARARAKAVIDDIRTAFGERVKRLAWMSDSTKAQALEKLTRMGEKVGYPDKWRDYSKLEAAEGPFVANLLSSNRFEWQRVVNRPGLAVDTAEWNMTVPTVNAYYNPTKNEMVFPAGALVPQTFDPKGDDGGNYGSLGGSWAGHELTHGFDDQGRQYDAVGNLRDWWTAADSVHFSQQGALVIRQYNGYIQVDSFHVNGALTNGENIADYGGVLTGFDALQRALERNGRPGLIEGFTPEQRYFLAYAQSYRGHTRPEQLRTRVKTDPHSPEEWRTNGPLSNMTEFAKAFGCKPGDAMVRERGQVAEIW